VDEMNSYVEVRIC